MCVYMHIHTHIYIQISVVLAPHQRNFLLQKTTTGHNGEIHRLGSPAPTDKPSTDLREQHESRGGKIVRARATGSLL